MPDEKIILVSARTHIYHNPELKRDHSELLHWKTVINSVPMDLLFLQKNFPVQLILQITEFQLQLPNLVPP